MSMFDKRKASEDQPEAPSASAPAPRPKMPDPVSAAREIAVIGKTIAIKGDVTGEESLVIDGKVDGTVILKGYDLTVGQPGLVTASVKARVVRIEGQVTGDISGTEKVVVTRMGRVQGNIVAPRVTLEDGAKFKGSIDMDPGSAEPAAAPKRLEPVPSSQPAPVHPGAGQAGPGHSGRETGKA